MPRRKLIRQCKYPYHVTSRTNGKDWFSIPMYETWDLCKKSFCYALDGLEIEIHCFVLMGNHYHLLLTTPDSNIDRFMMMKLSKLINRRNGTINHRFSNRYKWTIVDNQSYLMNVYRYIYQNPVRAKITKDCFSYPYSSLHFSSFESGLFSYRPHFFYSKEKVWIEKEMGLDFDQIIRKGLRKKVFSLAQSTGKFFRNELQVDN